MKETLCLKAGRVGLSRWRVLREREISLQQQTELTSWGKAGMAISRSVNFVMGILEKLKEDVTLGILLRAASVQRLAKCV